MMKNGRTEQVIIFFFFPPLLTSFLLVLLFLLGRSGLTETESSCIKMIGRGYVIEITFTFSKKRIELSYVDGSAAKVFQPFFFFFSRVKLSKLGEVCCVSSVLAQAQLTGLGIPLGARRVFWRGHLPLP